MTASEVQMVETIEIDDDDDFPTNGVIDLDKRAPIPEEIIFDWDVQIREQFCQTPIIYEEAKLHDLMIKYIDSLKGMCTKFENNEALRMKVYIHMQIFHQYYTDLKVCSINDYSNNMIDILVLYCNLELEVISSMRYKKIKKKQLKDQINLARRRIILSVGYFLFHNEEFIYHVFIKLNNPVSCYPCKEVMDTVYNYFLIKINMGRYIQTKDETFCRHFILFQKWKQIRHKKDWDSMDKFMFTINKRDPSTLNENAFLKSILTVKCDSTTDMLLSVSDSLNSIIDAYLNYVKLKNTNLTDELMEEVQLSCIDDLTESMTLGEDEFDDPAVMKALEELNATMDAIKNDDCDENDVSCFEDVKVKLEIDSDDEVEIVSVTKKEKKKQISFLDSISISPEDYVKKSASNIENDKELAKENNEKLQENISIVSIGDAEKQTNILNKQRNTEEDEDPLCEFSKFMNQSNTIFGDSSKLINNNDYCVENNDQTLMNKINCSEQPTEEILKTNSNTEGDHVDLLNEDVTTLDVCNNIDIDDTETIEENTIIENKYKNGKCTYAYGLITPPSDSTPSNGSGTDQCLNKANEFYTEIVLNENIDNNFITQTTCDDTNVNNEQIFVANELFNVSTQYGEVIVEENINITIKDNKEEQQLNKIRAEDTEMEPENDAKLDDAMEMFLTKISQRSASTENKTKSVQSNEDVIDSSKIEKSQLSDISEKTTETENYSTKEDHIHNEESNKNENYNKCNLNSITNINNIVDTGQQMLYNNIVQSPLEQQNNIDVETSIEQNTIDVETPLEHQNNNHMQTTIGQENHLEDNDSLLHIENENSDLIHSQSENKKINNNIIHNIEKNCSNSPTDIQSPKFEGVHDFSEYYEAMPKQNLESVQKNEFMNDEQKQPTKTIQSILKAPLKSKVKKTHTLHFCKNEKKANNVTSNQYNNYKNCIILSTSNSRLLKDSQLWMRPIVVMEPKQDLEKEIKQRRAKWLSLNSKSKEVPFRVDYDKSTTRPSNNDIVSYLSPLNMKFSINLKDWEQNKTGSLEYKNEEYKGKKPKKRKNETTYTSTSQSTSSRVYKRKRETSGNNEHIAIERNLRSVNTLTKGDSSEKTCTRAKYFDKPFRMDSSVNLK